MKDTQIQNLIKKEEQRQREQLQMIPSENYASRDVLQAVGSVVMNKYSEGQIGKRYYQGNANIDDIEQLCKDRAYKLFKVSPKEWGLNVQAFSGGIANLAVYTALLNTGDKLMGMFLYDGGHLSHGWKLPDGKAVSFTSILFESANYKVNPESGYFDYDEVEKQVLIEKPKILISGGTAYPRQIDHKRLSEIAKKVGAYYMADIAHEAGLVATGVNDSPFEYADIVTMTSRKTLRGPIGALIFSRIDLSEKIDYAVFPRLQGGPPNHQIAGIAVALNEALQPEFKTYTKQIIKNAQTLAEELSTLGLKIVSGGTDKHLLLIDLTTINVDSIDAALALEKANIICNKNTVPGETRKPWRPSGLRFGTPALTSRGMKETDMKKIAVWINTVLRNISNEEVINKVGREVKEFSVGFKVPGIDD
ncbi:serine hydroxymethyltransferase [Patescibacteria group bacterium]|nr:serine hydroxymethyltransferase [Patescibacteria group bacterium]